MDPIVESILEEQIAALRASVSVFDQQRAGHLATAQSLATERAGALARADEIQASLNALRGAGTENGEGSS